jgi:hypothetical protein
VRDLVFSYYYVLRSILRDRPELRRCLSRCRHCGIYFLTHPRNAKRTDLGCPFGCREAYRKQSSTERSVAYYRTSEGRLKRRLQNERRRGAVPSSEVGKQEREKEQRSHVREIERLAHGYFRGPESFREEIRKGNVSLPLQRLNQVPEDPEGCNEFERVLLKDLEIVQKYMQRVMGKSVDRRLKSRTFHAQANLLAAGILSRSTAFFQTMRGLHDRSGKA